MRPDEENRKRLLEAERLIGEVEKDIMPPSLARADLHQAREIILKVIARLF